MRLHVVVDIPEKLRGKDELSVNKILHHRKMPSTNHKSNVHAHVNFGSVR